MTEPALGDGPGNLNGGGVPNPRPGVGPSPLAGGQRRRVRRRVGRPPWVRMWLYFREGPPAELVDSLVEMCRPAETFSNRRGPWHRGLVVARERRFRKRRSPVERYVRHGAPGELARLVNASVRRHPIAYALTVVAVVWWYLPWMRPPVSPIVSGHENRPLVVGVDGMTPKRVRAALSAWRSLPGALLVVMDLGSEQSYAALRSAELTPEESRRVKLVRTCGDTVTLSADLASYLRRIKGAPGQLLVVTSPDTLERFQAVMQVMLGGDGWRLEGLPSDVAENPPESILRRWRDQLRGQFWRATGLSGKEFGLCRARGQGLL